jgi:flagellar basal-body rod modification protein FlgD
MAAVTGTTDKPAAGTSIFSARTPRAPGEKAADPADLGKDDFMKLMMAQLRHQDPMNPMDDQAFIAQVAQFNTLDQMTQLNETITAMHGAQQLAEASGMIGKVITALGPDGEDVTGTVTAVGVEKGVSKLHVGNTKIEISKVKSVAADAASLPAEPVAEAGGAA